MKSRTETAGCRSFRIAGALVGALALGVPVFAGVPVAAAAADGARPALAAVTPAKAAPALQGRNLVRNGTFAFPQLPNTAKTWRHGWTVQAQMKGWEGIRPGGFDLLNAKFAEHPEGYQAVDLGQEFARNGGIQQDIPTQAGVWYTLTFNHSPDAWPNCRNQDTSFTASVTDVATGKEIDTKFRAAPADGSAHWKQGTVNFRAGGDETTIAFHGNNSVSCQAAITDVHVTEDFA